MNKSSFSNGVSEHNRPPLISQARLDETSLAGKKKEEEDDNQKMNKLRHFNSSGLKDVMHSV